MSSGDEGSCDAACAVLVDIASTLLHFRVHVQVDRTLLFLLQPDYQHLLDTLFHIFHRVLAIQLALRQSVRSSFLAVLNLRLDSLVRSHVRLR